MTDKTPARPNSRWAHGKRRELDQAGARKSGYQGDLREQNGWYRGARINKA